MIKNYFKTALRNLTKNKIFSFINVAGLSIGISSALVIYLIVSYDLSFDKFQKDRNRRYRVVSDFTFSGEAYHNSGVTYPMPKATQKDLTGIENVVHFYTWDNVTIRIPEAGKTDPRIFKKQANLVFADDNYLKLLPYEWLAGSSKNSLNEPYYTVLSESNAKTYFPKLKPAELIGREIMFNDSIRAKITGVIKDLPGRTDFRFKIFVSRATLERRLVSIEEQNEWGSTNSASQLLIKLSPGTSPALVTKQINALYTKNKKPDPEDHSTTAFTLQPFGDIHFNISYRSFGEIAASRMNDERSVMSGECLLKTRVFIDN